MRITFKSTLPRREIAEQSQFTLTVKFWDDTTDAWVASTPTTVRYRITTAAGVLVLDWTSVTTGTSVSISVSPTNNTLQDVSMPSEARQLVVEADHGLTTAYMDSFNYRLDNLPSVYA